jgi:hypothetical protein
METFFTYIQLGLDHILNTKGYDHILFIVALTILYSLKEWKSLLVLITAFTIGHSTTLAFTVLDLINFDNDKIESLIILSISITAFLNIIRNGKTPNSKGMKLYYLIALLFGFIHGMGFASYLKAILGISGNLLSPLLGFNIGLELGQITIVSILLIILFLLNKIFKIQKESFIVITSSIILGVTIPILTTHDWTIFF